jgi:hypothetical protein
MITIDSDYVSYIGKTENKGMENIRTEDIFYIDSSSRQIIVPDSWTAVGTLQDHLAEKVWFAVDRFFDDRDFLVDSNQIMVNYINAASEGYVYICEEIYVWDPVSNEVLKAKPGQAPTGDELQRYNKVLFAWRISQNVTKKTGKITFAVRIGKFTLDIEGSELQVDPEGQDWIWNTTIASLNVLESISSETGLDDEGNDWGIGDIARWFKSIAVAERHLTAIFNLASDLDRVAVGPRGSFKYTYYSTASDGTFQPITVTTSVPPFEVPNLIQMLTTAGTLQTTACPWKYQLWVNTQETPVEVLVPTINDGAPTTEDVWSSSKTSAVINATSTADRAYTDSKILATTAAGGTTAAWATNPTTSYIQAQFGTSSATAATSGMSASGIRDYVKAQFTTTSNVSSSAGWTSSATKDYADSKIVNNPANTSTSVGLSASAVKDFMSTNYLSTSTIDDTATTAVDKVWSANQSKTYADNKKVMVMNCRRNNNTIYDLDVADLYDKINNGIYVILHETTDDLFYTFECFKPASADYDWSMIFTTANLASNNQYYTRRKIYCTKISTQYYATGGSEEDKYLLVSTPTTDDIGKVLTAFIGESANWAATPSIPSLPTATSADEGKVLMVDSNGDYVLGTVAGGTPHYGVITNISSVEEGE